MTYEECSIIVRLAKLERCREECCGPDWNSCCSSRSPRCCSGGKEGCSPDFAALLQWREGAMSAEFGGYADESAHLVTGLMVRDYLATFPLQPPLPFAENYYLHYPKVAFGHWPPLFYIAQAAWMLALPVSRASILLFMAAWMALLATILRRTLRAETSPFSSWCAAIILFALPLIAEYTGRIMAGIQVAPLMFPPAIFFLPHFDPRKPPVIVLFLLSSS